MAAVLAALLVAVMLAGCGGGSEPGVLVTANAGEPQNPLIPTNTNENNGGRIVDRLFAGLMSYDTWGNPTPEVAQSIDTTRFPKSRIRRTDCGYCCNGGVEYDIRPVNARHTCTCGWIRPRCVRWFAFSL